LKFRGFSDSFSSIEIGQLLPTFLGKETSVKIRIELTGRNCSPDLDSLP